MKTSGANLLRWFVILFKGLEFMEKKEMLENLLNMYLEDLKRENEELNRNQKQKCYYTAEISNTKIINLHNTINTIFL